MLSFGVQSLHPLAHATDIAAVRRSAVQLATAQGFDETEAGRVAIAVTEAATNILKHAGEGAIVLAPIWHGDGHGIDILAFDKGPGMANLALSMHDGTSSAGTAGTGLGAMRRMAACFDAYTMPGKGTVLHLRMWDGAKRPGEAIELGAVCLPIAGEEACGDGWWGNGGEISAKLLVVDGLGHGPMAATAAQQAIRTARENARMTPGRMLDTVHQALRPTRGAAVAITEFHLDRQEVVFAGVGNISASVIDGSQRKSLISHNGIAGHNMRPPREFSLPWTRDCLCVFHSDGLSTQWNADDYPGLLSRHPSVVAGVLYRDFSRGRDDATVVALRQRQL